MDILELFTNIFNKYRNNKHIHKYKIEYDNCIALRISSGYGDDNIYVFFEVYICDSFILLVVSEEFMCGDLRKKINIENTDLIFNTIDFILNNYSIEGLKQMGFNYE